MIKSSLHEFSDRILECKAITEADVRLLQRDVLADGIATRDEADLLLALDRAVAAAHPAWAAYLTGAMVEFVVWTQRPTGRVDAETARWLTASLAGGDGPTATAARIAFEVVQEAEQADEILVVFTLNHLQARGRARPDAGALARFAA